MNKLLIKLIVSGWLLSNSAIILGMEKSSDSLFWPQDSILAASSEMFKNKKGIILPNKEPWLGQWLGVRAQQCDALKNQSSAKKDATEQSKYKKSKQRICDNNMPVAFKTFGITSQHTELPQDFIARRKFDKKILWWCGFATATAPLMNVAYNCVCNDPSNAGGLWLGCAAMVSGASYGIFTASFNWLRPLIGHWERNKNEKEILKIIQKKYDKYCVNWNYKYRDIFGLNWHKRMRFNESRDTLCEVFLDGVCTSLFLCNVGALSFVLGKALSELRRS